MTVLDLPLDLQRLRHRSAVSWLRRAVYRAMVGSDGWPPTFRALAPGEPAPTGASPHLYVHLPFCARLCPHCPYTRQLFRPERARAYGEALRRELEAYLRRPGLPPVRSLYFGGGTPSLTPELVELGIDLLRPLFAPGAEVGVEVHPSDAAPAFLGRLRAGGVTRVSLGVESLRADLLKTLGRGYAPEEALEAIRAARRAGFECVDVNLIFGIPGQDPAEASADVERCLGLGVDQVSAYPLFTFAHTPLGRLVAEGRFPSYGDRSRLRAQRLVSEACRRYGLARTSVWSFTRPGVAPYSTVTREDYVGFGAGAGSKVGGEFWFNTFSVDAYVASAVPRPALRFQASERLRRAHWLYWQVYRTEVDPVRYRELFGRDLERDFAVPLAALVACGMAGRPEGRWRLTERGAIWVHRLQAVFSLAWIDELWSRGLSEPWPAEVVLS